MKSIGYNEIEIPFGSTDDLIDGSVAKHSEAKSRAKRQVDTQLQMVHNRPVKQLSPAELLDFCSELDSDDSDDDDGPPAKRNHVVMEDEFEAGVQELREKRPYLIGGDNTRHLDKSAEFLTYPRRPSRKSNSEAAGMRKPKSSPEDLLQPCQALDSDDTGDEDDPPSVRMHVLKEKDFEAGVQELRKRRPDFFEAGSTKHVRKPARLSTWPQKKAPAPSPASTEFVSSPCFDSMCSD